MPIISSILSLAGSLFTGLFGFKREQAATVQETLKTLQQLDANDTAAITSASQSISSILTQGSFLERNWRPLLMVVFMSIIIASFFGYTPPHVNDDMGPMMQNIWELLKIGLMGYIPARTIEKIVQQINVGSIIRSLINKKVV